LSEKRVTDLINLKIIEKTEQVFPEEIRVLRAGTNFMRRLTKTSKKALPDFDKQPHLRAIMELFCRNRNLAHFSIVCLVNAGYAETKILSRVALENFLLMRLFALKSDSAELWFSDPEKFRKKWTPANIRKTVLSKKPEWVSSYDSFYGLLSEYAHPSFKGWFEIFRREKGGVFISSRPEFNADYSSECIGLICFMMIQTVKVYTDLFVQWMDKETINEANNLMPKIHEMVRRHFEVRFYKKGKLLEKRSHNL
jgi:hypothetical protein